MGKGPKSENDSRRDEVLGRMLRTPPAPKKPPRKTTDEALEDLIEAIKGQNEAGN